MITVTLKITRYDLQLTLDRSPHGSLRSPEELRYLTPSSIGGGTGNSDVQRTKCTSALIAFAGCFVQRVHAPGSITFEVKGHVTETSPIPGRHDRLAIFLATDPLQILSV